MRYVTYEWLWRNGRLGNQLWQVASTAGIARALEAEPRFPRWEYEPYFSLPKEFFVQEMPPDRLDLGTNYLQELHYFRAVSHEVRTWFQPSAISLERMSQRDWPAGHITAVHVRRGDYLDHPLAFVNLGMDYYEAAMGAVREEHPDTTFMVFGDDPGWCEQHFPGCHINHGIPRPVELADRLGEPEDQDDIFALARCDEHIISNSSFAWWGAWLSDNPSPIYPSRWFGPQHSTIPWRRMIDDRWREMPC